MELTVVKKLTVKYNGRVVGYLADLSGEIGFQYDEGWLKDGFALSPFSLPLMNKVFVNHKKTFNGLYGVFADSLPDGWGELLFRRMAFNVFYGNKDDHGKNFAFLYDESARSYKLSPAYDITKTVDKAEHEMTVNGNGNPSEDDMLAVADCCGLQKAACTKILESVKKITQKRIS